MVKMKRKLAVETEDKMKPKENCFYHTTGGSKIGQRHQFGMHPSISEAIKEVERYNAKDYNGVGDTTDWNALLRITKLFQYMKGQFVLVWEK